jgi:phage-related protein (TIGR01555 family)
MKKAKKRDKRKQLVPENRSATPRPKRKLEQDKPRRIVSPSRLAAFSQRSAVTPYTIPQPYPGVVPKGVRTMAQDDAIGAAYNFAPGSYGANLLSEGLTWPGYAYLAELSQRSEYRKITETLAREMTRKWIKIQASGDDDKSDKIHQIEVAFDKYKIRDLFRVVAEHDGFFGRGQIYVDTGATNDPEELTTPLMLSPNKLPKSGLKALRIVSAMWTYPTQYNSFDPLQANYYRPTAWYIMGKQVHASRLLTFVGRELPDILRPAYNFCGLSMSQMAKPYVDNWLRTRQSVADLLHSFSVSGIKTNMQSVLGGVGGDEMLARAQLFNQTRDNRGLFMLDRETEDFFNVSTPLGTVDHLQAQAQEQLASVSSIPLVKLLGITPSGLNASSDGEIRSFYDFVLSYQEHLFGSHLETVLKLIQLNEFGEIDDEIGYRFLPLWELNETERASVRKTDVDTAVELINAGVLHPEEERKRLATTEDSLYHGLDIDDVPEPPEDPSNPSLLSDPAKSEHESEG